MESASALDALAHCRVRDLHLRAALDVMDDITVDHMGIQPLHRAWGGGANAHTSCGFMARNLLGQTDGKLEPV